jgi:hypothetical protein
MKKMLTLFMALAVIVSSFAATIVEPPVKKASDLMIPIGKNGEKISVLDLSRIKVKDYETISGKDLNFAQTASFKMAQRELRKSIAADGTINNKKLSKTFDKMATGDFNIGGFALGLLLGLIGVLIAYIISDDKKRARVKWSWIGFGVAVLLYILLLI